MPPRRHVAEERGGDGDSISRSRLADKTLEQQLSFEFSEVEREQREQRERDRKHISERRAALAVEAEDEPEAILKRYEVLRRRVEPIGPAEKAMTTPAHVLPLSSASARRKRPRLAQAAAAAASGGVAR